MVQWKKLLGLGNGHHGIRDEMRRRRYCKYPELNYATDANPSPPLQCW